jgi:hypothetical protein
MRKKFNPQEWINNTATTKDNTNSPSDRITGGQREADDIENIVSRIESNSIDITTAYADWRDIGFAFLSELGEQGREYFHRVSRFYPDYSPAECDKQYDNYLKSGGSGITIKTFFQKAKKAPE